MGLNLAKYSSYFKLVGAPTDDDDNDDDEPDVDEPDRGVAVMVPLIMGTLAGGASSPVAGSIDVVSLGVTLRLGLADTTEDAFLAVPGCDNTSGRTTPAVGITIEEDVYPDVVAFLAVVLVLTVLTGDATPAPFPLPC